MTKRGSGFERGEVLGMGPAPTFPSVMEEAEEETLEKDRLPRERNKGPESGGAAYVFERAEQTMGNWVSSTRKKKTVVYFHPNEGGGSYATQLGEECACVLGNNYDRPWRENSPLNWSLGRGSGPNGAGGVESKDVSYCPGIGQEGG